MSKAGYCNEPFCPDCWLIFRIKALKKVADDLKTPTPVKQPKK